MNPKHNSSSWLGIGRSLATATLVGITQPALAQYAHPSAVLVGLHTKVKPIELAQYTPPPTGLVGWWRGEDNAYDSAGGQNGLLIGVKFEAGVVGQAFSFAGNPNRVLIPDSPNFELTNSLSIAAWVYPKANSWHVLERTCGFAPACKLAAYTFGMDNAGKFIFEISNDISGAKERVSAPIEFSHWTQVTATLDGVQGEMRLYLAGVLVAKKVTSVRPIGALDPALQPGIAIGNTPAGGGYPFIGLVDEVLLYSRSLSPAEVTGLATLTRSR
jgi:hypothetical protein